jgi:hypothetical protein
MLWALVPVSTNLVGFPIVLTILWIIARELEHPRKSTKGLVGGLGIGLLMLVKPQYDVVFTAWLALCYKRRWLVVISSFAAHLLPILGWLEIIALFGWVYYDPEIQEHGQVIWIGRTFYIGLLNNS